MDFKWLVPNIGVVAIGITFKKQIFIHFVISVYKIRRSLRRSIPLFHNNVSRSGARDSSEPVADWLRVSTNLRN